MDFWPENQAHLTQYKFNTVPSRSCAQNYHERQLGPQFPVYYGDQQHKPSHSGYWPARHVPNWTNQETTNMMSSQNFPYSYGHPIQRHYSDVGEHQRQEARDWVVYQQQQERGTQRDKWTYNPTACKRDISQKNESNFRELEAWALRYSHSLPRRRRIEAELRGARQDHLERSDLQMLNVQDSKQWDRAIRQPAPKYIKATPASPSFDVKDKLSYQTKLYSQPPNYNAPPSYSVQFRSVSLLQKSENQNKLQQVLKQQEQEMFRKCPSKVETQEQDSLQMNRPIIQEEPRREAAKVIEGRKFKLNKKAGGMTIFCLVSRIADTEGDILPILQKQSSLEQPKGNNESQPPKQADEVDFKVQIPLKHARSPYSKLQAIPICQESLSKMTEKTMAKTSEGSVYEKLAVQSKYPLWRRPSCTSSTESDNASTACSKDITENNLTDRQNVAKSGRKTGNEKVREAKDDAMLMIDTTCVVVKLEVLQGPTKEQIHYLASENQAAQVNHIKPNNSPNIAQAEHMKALPEQEAKKNGGDGGPKSGSSLENSKSDLETLEERAKRICGLCDTTMTQLQEEDVQVLPEKNNKTKLTGVVGLKELHDVPSKSEAEKLQLGESLQAIESNTREKEESDEVFVPMENIEERGIDLDVDRKIQDSTMADDQEQEPNAETVISEQRDDPEEIHRSTDAYNNLVLRKTDSEVLFNQNESLLQVDVQNGAQIDEEVDKTKSFGVCINNIMQSTLEDANMGHLDFKVKVQDQEASENIREGHFGEQNMDDIFRNSGNGELSNPELETYQSKDVSCCSNDDTKDSDAMVQTRTMKNLEVDSGQEEGLSEILPEKNLSESVQNQDKPMVEEKEKHQKNKTEPKFEPNYGISYVTEDVKNSNKEAEVVTCDLEIQDVTEEVTEADYLQKGAEIDALEDATCKNEQSDAKEPVQGDILKVSLLKDIETDSTVEETSVKEEEPYDGQGGAKSPATDSEVEITRQDKEFLENVSEKGQADQTLPLDTNTGSTRILSEICEDLTPNDNTKHNHEENEICAENTEKQENISDTSDTLEEMHTDEKVKAIENVPTQEITDATSVRGKLEEATILVSQDECEQAKECETLKEMDLKSQSLDKSSESGCKAQNIDLQQCELEDSASKGNWKAEDLTEDHVKSDQENKTCHVPTNKDSEINDGGLVCDCDPNVNNHILEKSCFSTDPSPQSFPSASACDGSFESASCDGEGKYPKSLWDAVNRIRKHTAPDSENEEEEIMDSWDRDSLADHTVSYEQILDQGYTDMTRATYDEDLNTQDDVLSQCSTSSQESDGTIVDDELEELVNTESEVISNEDQGSDNVETRESETQNGRTVSKSIPTEDERSDATPDESML